MRTACGWLLPALLMGANCSDIPSQGSSRASGPELVPATAAQVMEQVRRPGARAVVVNAWATWCTPCRQEFPDLMRLRQTYQDQGLRLVLVSTDFPDQANPARRFLAEQGVDFPTLLKAGDDMSFINGLDPRWSGALPATFVYDGRGTLREFREGRTTFDALEPLVVAAMSATDSIQKEASP